ncbi:MAG TPA: succinyldiaminopimelate transaminase [Gammaproteobacteria bacterium]|nr:succinyldiaminopimelate transaminase [Gammaproteobacteria bacterium]
MNPRMRRLQPYPFERLAELVRDVRPNPDLAPVSLSIGEPQHAPPADVLAILEAHLDGVARYPATRGMPALREAICGWLSRRFDVGAGMLDPGRHVLPVNGTREALFAFAQCLVDPASAPVVLMPNPFYQIYEGAALLAGAEPRYLDCVAEHGFLPDLEAVPDAVWDRCQLLYLCSPGNPTGAVADQALLQRLIGLADRHDFVIASDECYSEIYPDEHAPPPGLLQACAAAGREDFRRCVVFHSLSKRSNLPGLRSGFVAGDPDLISLFLRYRTYHGSAMPPPAQHASIRAWSDEAHVRDNRALYRAKFQRVTEILGPVLDFTMPGAGFYLWPATPVDDTEFTRRLLAEYNVRVVPGSYLSRDSGGRSPGRGRVRISLVASLEECVEAAQRIRSLVASLPGSRD